MSELDAIHRAASALRTALAAKPMIRFDAPSLIGPVPQAGRMVERVETHGRHLEIEWDNAMVLHTHMRRSTAWHVYRIGEKWRKPYDEMRATIETRDWIAVCFNAPLVETFRRPDKRRHPGMGRLGPDLCKADVDLGVVVNLLLSYPDADARVADALLDQRVMCGLGNVFRCEVLWATGLSPFARVGSLTERDAIRIVNTAASLLRSSMQPLGPAAVEHSLDVYGRNGQRCTRCISNIDMRPMGQHSRVLYWCPGCQVHLDPRVEAAADDTPVMDPHPAAQRFLADLPWNRDAG